MLSHWERIRRISTGHVRVEVHVHDNLDSLGQAVREAYKVTHSLTCDVLDRASNEVKHFLETTEIIEG